MCTKKMYEEIMCFTHGEWAEFFMDSGLEFDDEFLENKNSFSIADMFPSLKKLFHKNFLLSEMEAA